MNRSRSSIQYIVKRYKTENSIENESRVGGSKSLYVNDGQYNLRQVKTNPFLSAPKLAETAERDLGKLSTNNKHYVK